MRWRCVERRHAVEEIRVIGGSRVILLDIREDLRVLFAVADGTRGLNNVRTLRVVVARMLLELLGEGNRSLEEKNLLV